MRAEKPSITVRRDAISVRAVLKTRDDVAWAIAALTKMQESIFPSDTAYDVILENHGENKLNVIREIRALTGLGLKEAKDLSETVNSPVLRSVSLRHATSARNNLLAVGASVRVEPSLGEAA